jgi:hypothetical protein
MTEASGGPANAGRSCSFIDPRARLSPASRGSCVGACCVLRSEREVGAPRALDYYRTEEEQVRRARRPPDLVLEAWRSPSAQPSASPHDRDVWGSSALIERRVRCFAESPARACIAADALRVRRTSNAFHRGSTSLRARVLHARSERVERLFDTGSCAQHEANFTAEPPSSPCRSLLFDRRGAAEKRGASATQHLRTPRSTRALAVGSSHASRAARGDGSRRA